MIEHETIIVWLNNVVRYGTSSADSHHTDIARWAIDVVYRYPARQPDGCWDGPLVWRVARTDGREISRKIVMRWRWS